MLQVGDQKRLSFRIRVEWPVTIETTRGTVEGKTKDVSAGGAHISCTEYLHLNEPISMIIKPPDREPLVIAAVVIWSNNKDESNRPRVIGIKFTEISSEDRDYLGQVALDEFKAKLPG